jgi:cell division protease FtsH
MQEVKRPKRPLIFYYVVMILVILLFNCIVVPYIAGKAISDVDYGTFMTMTENGEIGKVQLQRNQIIFTSNRAKLNELAAYLYEHETITGEEFMQILNAA